MVKILIENCYYNNKNTLPELLTPLQIQAKTTTHARSKHKARSHFTTPGWSTPSLMASTFFL